MPVRLTLYTEEEIRQLVELGGAQSEQEFPSLYEVIDWTVGDVEGPLVALSVWSGHEDGSLDEFLERYLATRSKPSGRGRRRGLRMVRPG